MKKFISAVLIMAMIFAMCAAGTAFAKEDKIIIKLADVQAENDVETQFEHKFAELVAEKSGGRIEVQVYPAGQMGEMADILASVQMGSIQMTRTNPSWLADAGVKSINILSLPFIFKDLDTANELLASEIGQEMLDDIEDAKIQVLGLGYLEPSSRHFFFKTKEVSNLDELKDMKIRVQTNSLATSMVEHLGASATPISYNELYTSLQTGIVDGADNPLKGILNMSFYEVGKYVLTLAHQWEASIMIINEDFFKGLSEEDQAIIREAMEEGSKFYQELDQANLASYRTALEEKGMVFVDPDNAQEWMDAVQPMYPEFAAGCEEMLQRVIDFQK